MSRILPPDEEFYESFEHITEHGEPERRGDGIYKIGYHAFSRLWVCSLVKNDKYFAVARERDEAIRLGRELRKKLYLEGNSAAS